MDYKQAKADAWQAYQAKNGPQTFQQFQTEWNKMAPNAAAFQFSYLPKEEQQKYLKSLNDQQKTQLLQAINNFPDIQDKIRSLKGGK